LGWIDEKHLQRFHMELHLAPAQHCVAANANSFTVSALRFAPAPLNLAFRDCFIG